MSRPFVALVAFGVALGAPASMAGELTFDGILAGRAIGTRGQRSWLDGGFGRLTDGASRPGDSEGLLRGQAHLGLDWRPGTQWRLHAHGVLHEGAADADLRAGIAEAFLQYARDLTPGRSLRLRAGTLFPATSRENTGPLWASPYTLTLSALNTWTAEEVRLTGLEGLLRLTLAGRDEVQLGATVFVGNDPMGSLIAWRGWSLGDRLTTLGEVLPLPPLRSLARGGGFAEQRRDGTRPLDELDGRPGWQARARWERPEAALLQVSYLDNLGDRRLHRGQYSWRSRFGTVGGEVRLRPSLVLVGEAMMGETGMGILSGPHVDIRYAVGYALVSWANDKTRLTARFDAFRNTDQDGTQEPNGESGVAWTAAAFWVPAPHLRAGVELVEVRAGRPAAADSGANDDTGARRIAVELRFTF